MRTLPRLPEDMGRVDHAAIVDNDGSVWLVLNDLLSSNAKIGAIDAVWT